MKNQAITNQDIKRELLARIRKKRSAAIFLTVCTIVTTIIYIMYVFGYTNGFDESKLHLVSPAVATSILPFIILLFAAFLLDYYYIDLYKAASGKFELAEEKLLEKKQELISYYRRTEKENSLYFPCGRIAVSNELYASACVGDTFYVVILRARKSPLLAFHTDCYKELQ